MVKFYEVILFSQFDFFLMLILETFLKNFKVRSSSLLQTCTKKRFHTLPVIEIKRIYPYSPITRQRCETKLRKYNKSSYGRSCFCGKKTSQ